MASVGAELMRSTWGKRDLALSLGLDLGFGLGAFAGVRFNNFEAFLEPSETVVHGGILLGMAFRDNFEEETVGGGVGLGFLGTKAYHLTCAIPLRRDKKAILRALNIQYDVSRFSLATQQLVRKSDFDALVKRLKAGDLPRAFAPSKPDV